MVEKATWVQPYVARTLTGSNERLKDHKNTTVRLTGVDAGTDRSWAKNME